MLKMANPTNYTEKRVKRHACGCGIIYLPKVFIGAMIRIDPAARELKVLQNRSVTPMEAQELKAYIKKIEREGLR